LYPTQSRSLTGLYVKARQKYASGVPNPVYLGDARCVIVGIREYFDAISRDFGAEPDFDVARTMWIPEGNTVRRGSSPSDARKMAVFCQPLGDKPVGAAESDLGEEGVLPA